MFEHFFNKYDVRNKNNIFINHLIYMYFGISFSNLAEILRCRLRSFIRLEAEYQSVRI